MKKIAKHCEGERCTEVRAELELPPARGGRFRTIANLYLCDPCYDAWMDDRTEVRHVDDAEPAVDGPTAVVGASRAHGGEW